MTVRLKSAAPQAVVEQPLSQTGTPPAGDSRPSPTGLPTAVHPRTAAGILGVTSKTLANWRSLGVGPQFLKYGGRQGPVRYRVADLLAWQQAHVRKSPAGDGGDSDG